MSNKVISLYSNLFILMFFISTSSIFAQELSTEQIYEKNNDCVVVVLSYGFDGKLLKQGSGVVINEKGWIVTNYHVYSESESMVIKHNDKIVTYTNIIAFDISKDILILKISENTFPSIKLGNSDKLKVGQKVIAIGSPLGLENSLSEGVISGLRNVNENKKDLLQITASISSGSSGGAILNTKGELIGISTMTLEDGQNLNFAIPVNDILAVKPLTDSDKLFLVANYYFLKGKSYTLYGTNGNFKKAIEYFTKYLEIYPNSAIGYYERGRIYSSFFTAGENVLDFEKGISDFTTAIKYNPEYLEALFERGEAFYYRRDYNKAIVDFNRIIEINAKEPYDGFLGWVYLNRGISYYEWGNQNKACEDWIKARSLGNTMAPIWLESPGGCR